MAPRILAKSTAVAFLALPWVTPAASEDGLGRHPVIDGEFELQPYELPDGQGYRHLTSMINEASNELVLFGGLGTAPFPPTPMNHNVYTSRLMAVDEARTHERLKALRQDFIEPKIAEHHGRVAKLMGDGALVEFARAWCARRLSTARPGPFLFRKGE